LTSGDRYFSVSEVQAFGRLDDGYADGMLGPEESTVVPFEICLATMNRLRFLVDVLGRAQDPIQIQALIDGRSQLILKGDTAQWHHLDYAAPGRHDFRNEPTIINGIAWYPKWPDRRNTQNQDCNCYSDVLSGVSPAIPSRAAKVTLRTIRSRGETTILQQPSAANGYTLIIEFNDNPQGGSDDYVVAVDFARPPSY
jgi:hypothetical protein